MADKIPVFTQEVKDECENWDKRAAEAWRILEKQYVRIIQKAEQSPRGGEVRRVLAGLADETLADMALLSKRDSIVDTLTEAEAGRKPHPEVIMGANEEQDAFARWWLTSPSSNPSDYDPAFWTTVEGQPEGLDVVQVQASYEQVQYVRFDLNTLKLLMPNEAAAQMMQRAAIAYQERLKAEEAKRKENGEQGTLDTN